MREFAKMPSDWIRNPTKPGLAQLQSGRRQGYAEYVAALMLYIAIVHNANQEPNQDYAAEGYAKLSYSDFEKIVGLSRATISSGLKVLEEQKIIAVDKGRRTSVYQLPDYNPKKGWAKLPYRYFYKEGAIRFFSDFHLRKVTELNALKLYLLVTAFRNNESNLTMIAYEKIHQYTGIPVNDIRSALSLLVTLELIQIDRVTEVMQDEAEALSLRSKNIYRLPGLKGKHLGNTSSDDVAHLLATSR
jgi:DNA-binding transcriptional ArsR family regulator